MNPVIQIVLKEEMEQASKRYGNFHSPHELWGVFKEEEEEYWDSVKGNKEDLYELLQACSVGLRYINQLVMDNPSVLDTIVQAQERRWS